MVAPFIGGNLHPIGGKIKSVFEDTKTRQNLFCCGTARHGHGKTTPVFDRGETASLFGIVIPLSYLCIVMEMARNGHGNQPRQVSSKTQSLTEIFGEVLSRTHRNDADASRQKQGKDLPFHNCGRFTVIFGIVIPLSYLCIVELKTNKN
jgi:hypothetical protein